MTTIITSQQAKFTVTVMRDGSPVAISATDTVKSQLFSEDGRTALFNPEVQSPDATGADWANGIVAVTINDAMTATLIPPAVMVLITGSGFAKRFRINVETADKPTRSALFIKDFVVDELRNDQLALMAQSFFPDVTLSDDFLWNKILAAESQIGGPSGLRVPLEPTRFFPNKPTQQQIDDLNGMPWQVDAGYEYYFDEFFQSEEFPFIRLRQKPVIDVLDVRLTYPGDISIYKFPIQWIKYESRSGDLRIVPNSTAGTAQFSGFGAQVFGYGRTIPFAIEINYVAGLTDAAKQFPELVDLIKRLAVLKIIEDGFTPSSGSISADGLSESMGVKMQDYRDTIDAVMNGPKGSNGGLMVAIHGIRNMVM